MGILQAPQVLPGQSGVIGAIKYMVTTDSLGTITTAGYLNNIDLTVFPILPSDILGITYSATSTPSVTGTFGLFTVAISNGTITLSAWVDSGNVLLPVVSGNVASFNGTSGQIKDSGIAANTVAISSITSPDAQSDLIWYDITCTAAALATAGKVNVQLSSGTKQYKVRNVIMNYSAAGLSGGGGDRLLALTDGTTVYNNAGITAALLGTPINTIWGGTGNPLAGTVALDTSTAAAANLYFQYSGGTTDYTTGSVVISVLVQRVA